MDKFNYLIVGAGFAGSVLAERLNSIGKKILLIDKRDHIGGNCYDYYDESGVLVHKYGPHYFRTNFDEVKDYLSRFTEWRPCEYKVRASINDRLYTFPINRNTLNEFFGVYLKTDKDVEEFLASKKETIENPQNAEEQVLSLVGREIYEAFFQNYTKKQWGVDPKDLDAYVTARIPIRLNDDDRYVGDRFQAMPLDGYHKLFEKMLNGIEVRLGVSFDDVKEDVSYDKLIFTGSIDEFFGYKYGELPYRSLEFEFENHNKEFYQDWSQINYPNEHDYTRIVEIKHVTGQKIPHTTIVKEYPVSGGDHFYPIPAKENTDLYMKYKRESDRLQDVYFVGRLAQYKYLNMDQVVKEAIDLFEKIKND